MAEGREAGSGEPPGASGLTEGLKDGGTNRGSEGRRCW